MMAAVIPATMVASVPESMACVDLVWVPEVTKNLSDIARRRGYSLMHVVKAKGNLTHVRGWDVHIVYVDGKKGRAASKSQYRGAGGGFYTVVATEQHQGK